MANVEVREGGELSLSGDYRPQNMAELRARCGQKLPAADSLGDTPEVMGATGPGEVDTSALLDALRHYFEAEAKAPSPHPQLLLRGVPAGDLKRLLEPKGGRLTIVFDPLPPEMAPSVLMAEAALPGCHPNAAGEVDLNFTTFQGE